MGIDEIMHLVKGDAMQPKQVPCTVCFFLLEICRSSFELKHHRDMISSLEVYIFAHYIVRVRSHTKAIRTHNREFIRGSDTAKPSEA